MKDPRTCPHLQLFRDMARCLTECADCGSELFDIDVRELKDLTGPLLWNRSSKAPPDTLFFDLKDQEREPK